MEFEILHARSTSFYKTFDRKSELQHQTHYCPGCGHGIAHKLIAEAIEELGAKDDTILVSPVGCSVFAYYYFDAGNVQAAHGRAAAVATGVKRAHPDKLVISYQGDGDLAAIGTAEIVHAANRGENITVFFVNNAIYGMTGGQLAPTTLVGQSSTTSPWGRRPLNDGYPLHVSELLASLEAPVYIERVALSDNKNIMRARKAVRKALELQKQKAGFTLVEILSPCPTIWKKDPVEARRWVAEKMIPAFPLGVFRDRKAEAPVIPIPHKTVAEALELDSANAVKQVPAGRHRARDLKINAAGFGGQGTLLLGILLAEMGMREGLEVSWLPSYGPEMRSGSAHCYVCLSHDRIGSPLVPEPDVLIAMNEISLRKFGPQVVPGGTILYNRESLPPDFAAPQARVICIPASEIADRLGSAKVANVIMLGALLEETECLPIEQALPVIQSIVKKGSLMELNERALAAGREFIEHNIRVGAVSQPDGFAY
ncbi:MAG TPA: 2-oxoacid:acceptor oxidoreductase family protein [Terriglobales bacterium]|nr:2-oxoacid:acceptor oxidoreductase family protein [Terriglobales bacterium]